MITIQRIFWAHMLLGVAALAVGYAVAGHLFIALIFVFLGAIWFAAQQRTEHGLEGIMLALFVTAAGIGFWLAVPGWLMLLAVVATLGAWDLDHFLQRLGAVDRVEFESGLGHEHLRRLGMVEALGFVAGLLALTAQAQIPFWWEALLALLAIIGISRVIAYIRKQIGE